MLTYCNFDIIFNEAGNLLKLIFTDIFSTNCTYIKRNIVIKELGLETIFAFLIKMLTIETAMYLTRKMSRSNEQFHNENVFL